MNPPKYNEYDYINFLTASPRIFTCMEAQRVQPSGEKFISHDAVNRLLHRLSGQSSALWKEARDFVNLKKGVLVLDDSTLDKFYAQKMELVCHHWSGKHHRVVKGINLISLLWTDGDLHIPCDCRIYNKSEDHKTKNDHFIDMLEQAELREFQPECVLFDSWYSGLNNLKAIRGHGWTWLTRLKPNRLVNPDNTGNIPVSQADISETGTLVHLKGYGFIKVFGIVGKNNCIAYWATNDLNMDELKRLQFSEYSWKIEDYHRGLKQFCGVERSHVRRADAQKNHIIMSIRTFIRLEVYCFKTGISWFEAKMRIIRDAVRAYLKNPSYSCILNPTA